MTPRIKADPDKHVVELRTGSMSSTVTSSISRARAPWESHYSDALAERPETAPRPAPIRHSTAKPHRIDANATIATIRALRDSYLEARHG